jgi:hypothetical protein
MVLSLMNRSALEIDRYEMLVAGGAVWLRICVQNVHTHAQHVDDLVDSILTAAKLSP